MSNFKTEYEIECMKNVEIKLPNYCPTVFDGAMCWRKTPAGSVAVQNCSNKYIVSTESGLASLYCGKNGKWFTNLSTYHVSANYTECGKLYYRITEQPDDIYLTWLPIIQKVCHVGYTLSIISLLIAIAIFLYFKRLHCSRNSLHMHLFFSSIMRSIMSLIKDIFFDMESMLEDTVFNKETSTFKIKNQWNSFLCKIVLSFRQYFIMSNYMMLLMEAIYLHNLIYFSVFSDKSSIKFYGIIGWITPLIFIIPWIILKIFTHNKLCWTLKDDLTTLLDIPIGTVVVINFILFLLIIRVLFLKLDSMYQQRGIRYMKLLKATLLLLPLFGIPYTISLILSFYIQDSKVLEIVWLFFDQVFTAFQGFFAALTYCLLNSDVQTEIKRKYYYLKERNRELRRSRTISNTLQSYLEKVEELSEIQHGTIENGPITTKF